MRFMIVFFLLVVNSKAAALTLKVVDSLGRSIPGTVISLCSAETKAVLKNALTDTAGICVFPKVPAGSYFITATAASSAVFLIHEADTMQTVALIEKITELAGVTITASKPLIRAEDDKITYHVENDPSLAGLSASDALSKVPFLNVDGNGNVQLKGQSSFQILLNGKQTAMFVTNQGDVLKAFPANVISRIEVITNPSAKYEGEGITALINIITKKKVAGYNGSSSFSYNTIGQVNPNTSFNMKYGKIGLSSFVYYARNIGLNTHGYQQFTVLSNPAAFSTRHSADTGKTSGYMLGGNLELSYEPDSLQAISIYGRLTNSGKETEQRSNIVAYNETRQPLQESFFATTEDADSPSGEVGIDYLKKFKHPEKTLSFNFNLQAAQQRSTLFSNQENKPGANRLLTNHAKAKNEQTSFQADHTIPLSQHAKLEIGARAILRQVNSMYNGTENSGELRYRQNVLGTYAVYTYRLSKKGLTFKAGGRVEKTNVNGHFINNSTTVRQDYYSFLPSFSVNKTLPDNMRLSFAYNRRLARPGLAFLNPYTDNRDPLFISFGNERLKPEFANNAEVAFSSFTHKISYNIALNTSFVNSSIQRFILFNESTGVTTQSYDNTGKSTLWGLNGSVSFTPSQQLTVSLNINASYIWIRNTINPEEKKNGLYGSASSAISFQPTEKIMLFSNVSYTAAPVQLQGQNGDYLFYNAGGGYWLYKKKLLLSAALINFMGKYWLTDGTFESAALRQKTAVYRPAGGVSFGIRYNFGKLKGNTSRKKGVTIDDTKADVNSN